VVGEDGDERAAPEPRRVVGVDGRRAGEDHPVLVGGERDREVDPREEVP